MAQHRVQQYMEKQKITPLFEELMNKVLHDQPDDPLVYLIRALYRKAGLAVPKELKPGTLRRSSPERLVRRSRSPDKTTSQAWAVASGPDLVDRSYTKPWKTNSKKVKAKSPEEADVSGKQGRKQKHGWVADTKVTTTTFDDLFEENQREEEKVKQKRHEVTADSRKAWASIGVEDGDQTTFYSSRGYTGPRGNRNDEDPLAGEIMLPSGGSETSSKVETTQSSSHFRGPKLEAQKHREELEKLLRDSDKASLDSGYDGDKAGADDVEDDAIELLEDPEDLKREGVTKISKSGYKLSRWMRQREEEQKVKLNINLYADSVLGDQGPGDCYQEDYYESDLERPPTGMSQQASEYSPGISDDEFESVSQVVGPRHPVWSVPDSDGETYIPKASKTLPEPSRRTKQGKLSATAPVRFDDQPYTRGSVESDNSFLQGGKSWSPGVLEAAKGEKEAVPDVKMSVQSSRSQGGDGWVLPDDTEVSVTTQWTEAQSSGRPGSGPPKAY